jgi:toxin ParE1/3/4
VTHRVVFRPAALDDLAEIESWIAGRADRVTATAYGDQILDACEALPDYPHRGSARSDLRRGLRTITLKRAATIVYVVRSDLVEIARILRRGRDIGAAFDEL